MDYNYAVLRLTTNVIRTLKPKHVKLLATVTYQPNVSMSELFRAISPRILEPNWIVVFKTLTLVHVLIKEGDSERIMGFLAANTDLIDTSGFRDKSGHPVGSIQEKNIKTYSMYIQERVLIYKSLKLDWITEKDTAIVRLRTLPIKDGLLAEISLLQRHIDALLGCSWHVEDLDQIVSMQAFRLLLWDMMSLFHLLNEAVLRILSSYFDMERTDAAKALEIYKKFSDQTKKALNFFETGRAVRRETGVDIPVFNHPPLSLTASLEEYLRAPDFEDMRAAYKLRKSEKLSGTNNASSKKPLNSPITAPAASTIAKPQQKEPPPLIDFFLGIDDELNAYTAAQSQAHYRPATFDAFWDPNDAFSQRVAADALASKAPQSENPFFAAQQNQQQLQQQLYESELQLRNAVSGQQSHLQQPNQFSMPLGVQSTGMSSTATGFYMNPSMQASGTNQSIMLNALPASNHNPFSAAAAAASATGNYPPILNSGIGQIQNMATGATPNPHLDPFSQLGGIQRQSSYMGTTPQPGMSSYAPTNSFGGALSQSDLHKSPANPFGASVIRTGATMQPALTAQNTGGMMAASVFNTNAMGATTSNAFTDSSTTYNPFAGFVNSGVAPMGGNNLLGLQDAAFSNISSNAATVPDTLQNHQISTQQSQQSLPHFWLTAAATQPAISASSSPLPPQPLDLPSTFPYSTNYSVMPASIASASTFGGAAAGQFNRDRIATEPSSMNPSSFPKIVQQQSTPSAPITSNITGTSVSTTYNPFAMTANHQPFLQPQQQQQIFGTQQGFQTSYGH
ncbi:hypothetical protein BSLG_009072 [Batrachochytrium salamandrivorans]|nr:hypothetical protein BSLG_009072 [Batrachochytrium salamandrivorans]